MKKILVKIIIFYQKAISPFFSNMGIHCKYEPTCSEYMIQAIKKYGSVKGIFIGTKRFLKCNPFSKGGYDPLK
ncbi:MAG: membrane protein insertion efficiency factor YidD [Candidatus Scatovivens sp.]